MEKNVLSTKPGPVLNRNAHISKNNFCNFDMEICNLGIFKQKREGIWFWFFVAPLSDKSRWLIQKTGDVLKIIR